MILTCPECATSYFVADDKVGPDGRTVKCASCGHRWHAAKTPPEADLELFADPELGAMAREAAESVKAEPVEDLSELPGPEIPKVIRQRKDTERKVREAAAVGVVWAGMAASLAVLVAMAVVFRGNVVDLWPKSAAAYASVGLPVNRVGLSLEQVRAEPALQDGHAALSVSGVMRNIEDRTVMAPPLTVVLLSPDGHRVGGKIAAAQDPAIPPGETRHFAIVLLDPPANAKTLEVAFVYDPGAAKAVRAAVHMAPAATAPVPATPSLRGAALPTPTSLPAVAPGGVPVGAPPPAGGATGATPLPQSSPYALPEKSPHG
jgi:predicted Zn finger-like uncharacterized protein